MVNFRKPVVEVIWTPKPYGAHVQLRLARKTPGRIRRFYEAVKRNLFPAEPLPGPTRDVLPPVPPRSAPPMPPVKEPGTYVRLPRHQVVMLRHGFAELLKWAISERDCFFQCNTDAEGNVLDREDRITLDGMDAEIDRAQYALRDFDRVYPNA